MSTVNAGGFYCLSGETPGVNLQHDVNRMRPSGPGTARVWNVSPVTEKLVCADPGRRVTVAVRLNLHPRPILSTVQWFASPEAYLRAELDAFLVLSGHYPVAPVDDHGSEACMRVHPRRVAEIVVAKTGCPAVICNKAGWIPLLHDKLGSPGIGGSLVTRAC